MAAYRKHINETVRPRTDRQLSEYFRNFPLIKFKVSSQLKALVSYITVGIKFDVLCMRDDKHKIIKL